MNQQNSEGFTALLYAAYNGHLDIIRYLVEEHGVNDQLVTKTGLNPLHLAAQKNMVLPFLYFRDRIDLNAGDTLRSSPLHWAAYMNSEQAVAYMLSEARLTCLDSCDSEGNTALMLAVTYGNTRVVRRLLIAGADRYIANTSGKIPYDVAVESEFLTISRMLNEQYGCCDFVKFYCNVKMEYRPKGRSLAIPMVFLATFLLNTLVLNLSLKFTDWLPVYLEIVVLASMMILYLTLLRGPGRPGDRNELE
jgi:hypothetical protein